MTKGSSFEKLVHEAANDFGVESATIAMLIHIFLQILLAEFEDEDELRLAVDDIVEAHDVGMLELLHQGDLTNCCGWRPFLCIQVNLLECHNFVCRPRPPLAWD